MKHHSILLLILVGLLCPSPTLSQDPEFPEKDTKVTIDYDKKTDTTVVRFGPMHLMNFSSGQISYAIAEGELRLSAFFTYKGKTLVKPESIALIFLSVNRPLDRWELSQHKDMEIAADSGHWKIPKVEVVDSKNNNNLVIESLGVSIPCEIFGKIANARKVNLRLGDRARSEEHTSELQSRQYLVCRL